MSTKNPTTEQNRTTGGTHTSNQDKTTTGQMGNTGTTGQTSPTTGSATQRAREQGSDITNRGSEVLDQTRQVVSNAYDKTTEALSGTYDQAMSYGKEHPGQLTLIAFGAGIAVGLLLASGGGRSRTGRIVEPAVNALSQIALELFGR